MTPSIPNELKKHVLNTISYFAFFRFTPTFEHIYAFFPTKITQKGLKIIINRMISAKQLIKSPQVLRSTGLNNPKSKLFPFNLPPLILPLYTLPQYSKYIDKTVQNYKITRDKINSVSRFIITLGRLPCIRMITITGSSAMNNGNKNDDVDLMIVTANTNLWTGRFFAILLAHILRVRNTACLNLFFDESDMTVAKHKQTLYVAHEILQMKPVINKMKTYEKFLAANRWTNNIYPNSSILTRFHLTGKTRNLTLRSKSFKTNFPKPGEFVLKQIQNALIRKNKTGFLTTSTQLWLFRKDFEKKLPDSLL